MSLASHHALYIVFSVYIILTTQTLSVDGGGGALCIILYNIRGDRQTKPRWLSIHEKRPLPPRQLHRRHTHKYKLHTYNIPQCTHHASEEALFVTPRPATVYSQIRFDWLAAGCVFQLLCLASDTNDIETTVHNIIHQKVIIGILQLFTRDCMLLLLLHIIVRSPGMWYDNDLKNIHDTTIKSVFIVKICLVFTNNDCLYEQKSLALYFFTVQNGLLTIL